MSEIYVVTKGCYSDYHIIAATTNKTAADEIARKMSTDWEAAQVEVFSDAKEYYKKNFYNVRFDKYGHVKDIVDCDTCDLEYTFDSGNYLQEFSFGTNVIVNADSADQAIKIACDTLAKHLAEKIGL